MPEVVQQWVTHRDIFACTNTHHAVVCAYQKDFQKYARSYQLKYVELLFKNIPYQLGRTFKFHQVPGNYRKRDLQPCLELLMKANLAQSIYHSSGQGIPLGAEANLDRFKMLFIAVALSETVLGLDRRLWLL